MKNQILRTVLATAFVLACGISANAQKSRSSTSERVAKAVIVVVGQTAKVAAKSIVVVAPLALKFTGETAVVSGKALGFLIEKSLPVARKLIVTYLKVKLPL
jgi:hypothetical protein